MSMSLDEAWEHLRQQKSHRDHQGHIRNFRDAHTLLALRAAESTIRALEAEIDLYKDEIRKIRLALGASGLEGTLPLAHRVRAERDLTQGLLERRANR